MNRLHIFIPLGFIIFFIFLFFHSFIIEKKLPIPADTIVGLYHPFRDMYAKEYRNGIPYKNFLITDPVRQQYPWRNLVIEDIKKIQLPLWNPYNFSGTPLLANIQAAAFFPGNILFAFLPFMYAWSILIVIQPLAAALFLYIYLRSLRISCESSMLGALTFSFSGFFIAWLEWGTVLNVALWLPLLLLCVDKIIIQNKKVIFWCFIFLFSLSASFFAGHLQTFFYLFIFLVIYFLARWFQYKKDPKILCLFFILNVLFIAITAIQWYPTLQLIGESARDIDQAEWTKAGWFIPWQHSIQFLAPDFFGNPTSLNYWSEWNYAEFVGYIGIVPFVMALHALIFRRDKKTLFFSILLGLSLLFAFPTFLAKLPFIFSIPFLSTAQPTRLLFLIDFSFAVLAAFGLDYFLKHQKKIFYPLLLLFCFFSLLWLFIFFGQQIFSAISSENIVIAKRNLLLPTVIFIASVILCSFFVFMRQKKFAIVFIWFLIGIAAFDLFRFGAKFVPFTKPSYLYPSTSVIKFLQNQKGQFRIMTTDSRIFPPNFSAMYHIQSVDGYDPLYLRRYGELIAVSERNKPDISPPFGFNRIITPHNYESKIIDLLNVRYVLSLSDINSPKLQKVFQEGETRVYENTQVMPRVFFVDSLRRESTKQKVMNAIVESGVDLRNTAVVDDNRFTISPKKYTKGKAAIVSYTDNKVVITTENKKEGFLVFTDIYYPIWKVHLYSNNRKQARPLDIVRTDYLFRGILVPPGKHTIVFYTSLL